MLCWDRTSIISPSDVPVQNEFWHAWNSYGKGEIAKFAVPDKIWSGSPKPFMASLSLLAAASTSKSAHGVTWTWHERNASGSRTSDHDEFFLFTQLWRHYFGRVTLFKRALSVSTRCMQVLQLENHTFLSGFLLSQQLNVHCFGVGLFSQKKTFGWTKISCVCQCWKKLDNHHVIQEIWTHRRTAVSPHRCRYPSIVILSNASLCKCEPVVHHVALAPSKHSCKRTDSNLLCACVSRSCRQWHAARLEPTMRGLAVQASRAACSHTATNGKLRKHECEKRIDTGNSRFTAHNLLKWNIWMLMPVKKV